MTGLGRPWQQLGLAVVVVVGAGMLVGTALNRTASLAGMLLVVAGLVAAVVAGSKRDATAVLSLMLGLLFLIPEDYVFVGPLKSMGNPALLVGMACFVLWAIGRVVGWFTPRPHHPVRWALLCFGVSCLAALAASGLRVLTVEEASGSVRSIAPTFALLGIALLAVDSLASRQRLDDLLLRLVVVGGVAALIGVAEFLAKGFSYQSLMHLPGLTTNTDVINDVRSGFRRVDGAAAHPIEYAVSLAALAPIALHFALHGATRWHRRLSVGAVAAILLVNPMTVSRSGLLALGVGLGLYAITLSTRAKVNVLALAVVGLVLFRAAIPGLLGTLRSLFLIGDKDPSISGRTEDYAKIGSLMDGHWLFGRGLGTFQPLQYFFLDNQYLGSLLEGGLVELAAFAGICGAGFFAARTFRRRSVVASDRALGQAVAGSILSLAVSAVTFDELSFHQTGFLLFLLVGVAGWLRTSVDPPSREVDDVAGSMDDTRSRTVA